MKSRIRAHLPEGHSVSGAFRHFDPAPEHDGAALTYGTLHLEGPRGQIAIAIQSETMMAKLALLQAGGLRAADPIRIDFVPDPGNPRRLIPAFIERGLPHLLAPPSAPPGRLAHGASKPSGAGVTALGIARGNHASRREDATCARVSGSRGRGRSR